MSAPILAASVLVLLSVLLAWQFKHPLRPIPGPLSYRLSKWRLGYVEWCSNRTRTVHKLHKKYGSVVRVAPNEVSFSSLTALKQIYGAGSGFDRTTFYRLFDVYGRPNLFSFGPVKDHAQRKKMLHHEYSKTQILVSTEGITGKVRKFLDVVEGKSVDIYLTLLFYSLDNITHFIYGAAGGTNALLNPKDRIMLNDQLDPRSTKLAWFAKHARWYILWLAKQNGTTEQVLKALGMYPQQKPFIYTGIRDHALTSYYRFKENQIEDNTIISRLMQFGLDDLDIASECADHFLAGINTTTDTLTFLIWALSRTENQGIQEKLRKELRDANLGPTPTPKAITAAHLPYFDAVINEALRVYGPLTSTQPRVYNQDCHIDGYFIPAGTIVSCQGYTLHRNPEVFSNPDEFIPERWLTNDPRMKQWFWAFSSGGRMCIGIHFAMAEVESLAAALYVNYHTSIVGDENFSPGTHSRSEHFYDDHFTTVKHDPQIKFEKLVY